MFAPNVRQQKLSGHTELKGKISKFSADDQPARLALSSPDLETKKLFFFKIFVKKNSAFFVCRKLSKKNFFKENAAKENNSKSITDYQNNPNSNKNRNTKKFHLATYKINTNKSHVRHFRNFFFEKLKLKKKEISDPENLISDNFGKK